MGSHPAIPDYIQGSLLAVLKRPNGVLEMKTRSATCKASVPPIVLSLLDPEMLFFWGQCGHL